MAEISLSGDASFDLSYERREKRRKSSPNGTISSKSRCTSDPFVIETLRSSNSLAIFQRFRRSIVLPDITACAHRVTKKRAEIKGLNKFLIYNFFFVTFPNFTPMDDVDEWFPFSSRT